MVWAILFLGACGLVLAAAIIAIFATVEVYYLSGSRAIADDGLRRGSGAPSWSLAGSSGQRVVSPPRRASLQVIVFADHSLASFPSVAEGLQALVREPACPDIVLLTRHSSGLVKPALEGLGLGSLEVVTGSPALYGKYNVRVMPFIVAVDSAGRVRASSLVNHAWQVEKLWRLARVDLDPTELARRTRLWPGRALTGA